MTDILEVYDIKNNTIEDIGDKKSRANIATAFNTSKTYAINDLTVYNGELYKFTTAHSAGAWNINQVVKTTIDNEKVSKSGDTITGSLVHEASGEYGLIIKQIDDSSVLPNEDIYSRGIAFRDKNNNPLGYFRQVLSTTGTSSIDFTSQKNVNGTNIYNILSVGVNADGSGYVYLSEPDAWCNALGLTWTRAGSATNTGTVSVPETAKEVKVLIQTADSNVLFTGQSYIEDLLPVWLISGYYVTSTDFGLVNLNVTNSSRTFQLRNVKYGGQDTKSRSTLIVYYR